MAGPAPAIHAVGIAWMAGTSQAMTFRERLKQTCFT
jgi:hypothetical protein